MNVSITQLIVSSLISLIIGIVIGEPVKHFITKYITHKDIVADEKRLMNKINQLMPSLILEMKSDLNNNPLNREFIIMSKNNIYNGESVVYYFEEHPDLKRKMEVLVNHGLIANITYNNVDRYKMTEQFAELLGKYI